MEIQDLPKASDGHMTEYAGVWQLPESKIYKDINAKLIKRSKRYEQRGTFEIFTFYLPELDKKVNYEILTYRKSKNIDMLRTSRLGTKFIMTCITSFEKRLYRDIPDIGRLIKIEPLSANHHKNKRVKYGHIH